jgi:hypothetical protein
MTREQDDRGLGVCTTLYKGKKETCHLSSSLDLSVIAFGIDILYQPKSFRDEKDLPLPFLLLDTFSEVCL